ncbi:MAG: glycosyltransferase, partial [Oscillospiraceae bacterium]
MKLKLKRIKELFALGIEYVKTEGLSSTIKKTFSFFTRRFAVGYGKLLPRKKALEMRRAKVANGECDNSVKISVCIPIYNTPEKYLTELLQSVTEQIYPNWQLCLADASDEVGEKTVQKVLSNFADERIVYKKIKNIDIATNSNEAASLANGEYIAL